MENRARVLGYHKIVFELERDELGYPPVKFEGLWARKVEGAEDVYAIENVPFYAYVAVDDQVRAVQVGGELRPVDLVLEGGHGTVRVMGPAEQREEIRALASACGCSCERSESMLAIDVPPSADWLKLRDELTRRHAGELLDYEEAVLPPAWR